MVAIGHKLKTTAHRPGSHQYTPCMRKHSLLRSCVCGSLAPWQLRKQASQSIHLFGSRSMRHSEKRDATPKNAPSGHTTRQKKRGNHHIHTDEKETASIRSTSRPHGSIASHTPCREKSTLSAGNTAVLIER